MERIFASDELTKRERVERTLRHEPVDRVALHDQLSYNPGVIADWTGRAIDGFGYTLEDIGLTVRRTLDMCFPPVAPRGKARVTTAEGFVFQHDEWTTWRVKRPFDDVAGAREWLERQTEAIRRTPLDPQAARAEYHASMAELQRLVGETVVCNFSHTGFCGAFDAIGLELYVFLYQDHPAVVSDYVQAYAERELARVEAVADPRLSPVILIPEDFATKHGPIFPPQFLAREHYPHVKRLTEAWHRHDVVVLYHSDGNYRRAIPALMDCGVDGFYCLEPGLGMDIAELKTTWPEMVWAGGVDGVDLLERGTPEQVRAEVRRHILATDALATGGMFVGSSSEINPPIKPANFRAMVKTVGETGAQQ